MTTENKWLIFPLEIIDRELNGKLLICQEAIRRGWKCIIGTEHAIIKALDHMPPGLFFLKSALYHEIPYLRRLKSKGHKIVCLDEEGLVQNNLEYLVSARSTEETVQELDACLFWGTVQRDAYKAAYPAYAHKFHVTCNARIDIWSKEKYHALYKQDVDGLHARYGEYFIIPTSFGSYNHLMGKDGAMEVYKAAHFITEDSVSFFEEYEEYAKNIFYGFIDIIDPLSKAFPETNIIVRPHPSENREPWDKLAENYENVHVIFEGSVTPWLLASKAVLHCGSTTAVEAHLMGRPVVSYCRGYNDPRYQLEVPAKVSINVTKEEEVLDLLRKVENGEDINKQHPEIAEGHTWLRGWIDSLDSYESSVKIMDTLENLEIRTTKYTPRKIHTYRLFNISTLKSFVWFCLQPLGYIPVIKDILPFRIKFGIRVQGYNKKKIKNINLAEVERFISKVQSINGGPQIEIKTLSKNIIALAPAEE